MTTVQSGASKLRISAVPTKACALSELSILAFDDAAQVTAAASTKALAMFEKQLQGLLFHEAAYVTIGIDSSWS